MNTGTKIALAIFLGSVVIAIGFYFGLREVFHPQQIGIAPTTPITSSTPAPSPIATSAVNPTTIPSPTPKISWTNGDITTALSQKTGIAADKINFSVSDKISAGDKILIRGGVSEKGTIGGAGFFGYIDQSGVHITYSGQGVPPCSAVNPYHYPLSWADYCINAQGQTVRRH